MRRVDVDSGRLWYRLDDRLLGQLGQIWGRLWDRLENRFLNRLWRQLQEPLKEDLKYYERAPRGALTNPPDPLPPAGTRPGTLPP